MNQRGIVTLDFIYGLVLTCAGFVIAITIAFTMAVIEVGQYVAFSTSRAFLPTRFAVEDQVGAAAAKFEQLLSEPSMRVFKNSDWFEMTFPGARNFKPEMEDAIAGRGSNMLWGTDVRINAKVLGFRVPFFGSTTESGEGLQTAVNSLLGREVSDEECLNFNAQRWEKIKALAPQSQALPNSGYSVLADNGC
jgi:hypothetical protein